MTLTHHQSAQLVELSVRVPACVEGDLVDAAATVLERSGAVEAVEALRVTGVSPRSNAVVVEAEADLVVEDLDPPEDIVAVLEELVGVDVREIDRSG